jgi:hypothetical protein
MIGRLQLIVFVASSGFLAMYVIWLVLAVRFAARWKWLRAFHSDWRHGITTRNAVLYGLAAMVAWLIANSALVLLAGVPPGAQILALTLWVSIATVALVAWGVAYSVLSRRRDSGTPQRDR